MHEGKLITAVIVDDEKNNCAYLCQLIEEYCPTVKVVGSAYSASEGVTLINKHHPKLVFLDVRMPGGDGFDLLSALPKRSFEVIFVTAYNEYAIKAIRFCAFDYLLKPINIIELQHAIGRVAQKYDLMDSQLQKRWALLDKNSLTTEKRMALPSLERINFVCVTDIMRCESDNNYTYVFVNNGEKIFVTRTLKEFDDLLEDDGFIRVHQSHLVNRKFIKSFEKQNGGHLCMIDDTEVPVSRMRKEQVLSALK